MNKMLSQSNIKKLKQLAHPLKPVVLIGQSGVTDAVMASVEQALFDHELIKVRMHEPEDKNAFTNKIIQRLRPKWYKLVGHTLILYKQNEEKPKLNLGF